MPKGGGDNNPFKDKDFAARAAKMAHQAKKENRLARTRNPVEIPNSYIRRSLQTLYEMQRDPKIDAKTKVDCARSLVEHGMGRPAQRQTAETQEGVTIVFPEWAGHLVKPEGENGGESR